MRLPADDADLIYELNRDPEVTGYTCDPMLHLEQDRPGVTLYARILGKGICNGGRIPGAFDTVLESCTFRK